MSLSASSVAAAGAAWVRVPDNATVVQDDQFTIVRMPDYVDCQLSVLARKAGFAAFGQEPLYDVPLG